MNITYNCFETHMTRNNSRNGDFDYVADKCAGKLYAKQTEKGIGFGE